jgi:mono/diheme cytochrome c family protein
MRRSIVIAISAALAAGLSACGQKGIEVADNDPLYHAAETFQQRCGACHTFDIAGTEGSSINPNSTERKDGPNFNTRPVEYEEALYAIQNGGFSSGPMPQNLVVGDEAKEVACFVAVYSGRDAKQPKSPGAAPAGAGKDTCVSQLPGK